MPSEALNKKEDLKDVVSYLENWVEGIIVRHSDIELIERMSIYSRIPIINAMTCTNHPCEILSDLYSVKRIRDNYLDLNYTFIGADGNIGRSWVEASNAFGINLTQVCPKGYEIQSTSRNFNISHNLDDVIINSDIVLTDSVSENSHLFAPYRVTVNLMSKANKNALLNPCPPFFRGEEVSADVIDSSYFVGYEFKKSLLYVQQAIILFCCEILK